MRNLFNFLYKNSFFFLFLILEIIAFLLIFANNSYQRSAFISASNGVTSSFLSAVTDATDYFSLKVENEILAKENASLRSELIESNLWHGDSVIMHSDSLKNQFYTFTEARIINNNFQNRNNYLVLNKGSVDGIEAEMGVISPGGVVGIVNQVSKHFSSVISILHNKSAIDAKIVSNGYTGTTHWQGGDYTMGLLNNIPSHAVLKLGDTVVTSGNSTIFPPEISIGVIKDFSLKPGENFYSVDIRYSVDYNKISHVYIVHNLYKEELLKIREGEEDEK